MNSTAYDSILSAGISLASDTAEFNSIRGFNVLDATTNPSLVYAAVSKPEYTHLIEEALTYANTRFNAQSLEAKTELAMDYLLASVGANIAKIVPGRVSVSVDPRLSHDTNAIVKKGQNLVSILEELQVPRERVLVKIPATYSGILAARILERISPEPIHTNMTLVFGRVQALACAQARLSVISPFIGRVKDWYLADPTRYHEPNHHPGVLLVRRIRRELAAYGYTGKTHIMAAGFRHVEEIVALGKAGRIGGPDLFTLPPDLLKALQSRGGFGEADATPYSFESHALETERVYVTETEGQESVDAERLFIEDLNSEGIALDKVPEGLDKFSADVVRLEAQLKDRLAASSQTATKL